MIGVLARQEVGALLERLQPVLDESDNPFATSAFLLALLDEVASDDWVFAGLHQEDGLALLYAEPPRPGHWHAFTNYYASLYSPWSGRHADGAVALAEALSETYPAHTVNLAPLSQEDADDMAQAFRARGWFVRQYDCFGNWYLPCAGLPFDVYMEQRPSQTLNTWRRKARKFSATGSEARLELVTDERELARAIEAYSKVYAKSWKQPEPYPGFVPAWALQCARRGWLRLGLAWVHDEPVAAQFWFTRQGRACIFKLAYDEDFSRYSAGTVLSAFMFRHALEVDRVHEIDYLTGDDPYKQSWMSHRRERRGLMACNLHSLRGAARSVYEWVGMVHQRLRPGSAAGPFRSNPPTALARPFPRAEP